MKNREFYNTIVQLLTKPRTSWSTPIRQPLTFKKFLYSYWLPVAGLLCIIIFCIHLFLYSFLQSVGLTIVQFITIVGSFRLVFLLAREYLCRKLNYPEQEVLSLIGYSYAIYFVFYSIGQAFGDLFVGQIFTLISLCFIRTLYYGITELRDYQPQHQTNILIVSALSIIFIPVIVKQLLTILFGIPAIHV